jgi:hypothetical protein
MCYESFARDYNNINRDRYNFTQKSSVEYYTSYVQFLMVVKRWLYHLMKVSHIPTLRTLLILGTIPLVGEFQLNLVLKTKINCFRKNSLRLISIQ